MRFKRGVGFGESVFTPSRLFSGNLLPPIQVCREEVAPMMDSLALPVLFGTLVLFVVGIWAVWLTDPKGRALLIDADEEE